MTGAFSSLFSSSESSASSSAVYSATTLHPSSDRSAIRMSFCRSAINSLPRSRALRTRSNAGDVLGPGHVGLRLRERLVEASVERRLFAFSFICSPFIEVNCHEVEVNWHDVSSYYATSRLPRNSLSSYGFPSNKFVNIWACTRYVKYHSGIMIAPSGLRPSGAIIIPS